MCPITSSRALAEMAVAFTARRWCVVSGIVISAVPEQFVWQATVIVATDPVTTA